MLENNTEPTAKLKKKKKKVMSDLYAESKLQDGTVFTLKLQGATTKIYSTSKLSHLLVSITNSLHHRL